MDAMQQRERAFEARFAYDQDLDFRAQVRRDRKLGLWAASLLGKQGGEAEEYAQSLIAAEIEGCGCEALVGKLRHDFQIGRVTQSDHQIRREMDRCYAEAKREVRGA